MTFYSRFVDLLDCLFHNNTFFVELFAFVAFLALFKWSNNRVLKKSVVIEWIKRVISKNKDKNQEIDMK